MFVKSVPYASLSMYQISVWVLNSKIQCQCCCFFSIHWFTVSCWREQNNWCRQTASAHSELSFCTRSYSVNISAVQVQAEHNKRREKQLQHQDRSPLWISLSVSQWPSVAVRRRVTQQKLFRCCPPPASVSGVWPPKRRYSPPITVHRRLSMTHG